MHKLVLNFIHSLVVSISIVATVMLLLSGCKDPNAATAENFIDALNRELTTKQALIPAPGIPSTVEPGMMVIQDLEAVESQDQQVSDQEKKMFRRQLTYAKLLQSAGIVTLEHGYYKHRTYRGDIINLYGYKLHFNRKFQRDIKVMRDGKVSLIVGNIGVNTIVSFTEPKTRGNTTITKVTYKRAIINRPEWASDAIIKYAGIEAKMKNSVTSQLILTDTGWEVLGAKQTARGEAAASMRQAIQTGNLKY